MPSLSDVAYLSWVTLRLLLVWSAGGVVIGYFLHKRGYDVADALLAGLALMWSLALGFGFFLWLL